jgi:hypothetical protein
MSRLDAIADELTQLAASGWPPSPEDKRRIAGLLREAAEAGAFDEASRYALSHCQGDADAMAEVLRLWLSAHPEIAGRSQPLVVAWKLGPSARKGELGVFEPSQWSRQPEPRIPPPVLDDPTQQIMPDVVKRLRNVEHPEGGAQTERSGSTKHQTEPADSGESFTPQDADIGILDKLNGRQTRTPAGLLDVPDCGQRKLGERLRGLEAAGLVDRAEGKRSGWAITDAGRRILAQNLPEKRT